MRTDYISLCGDEPVRGDRGSGSVLHGFVFCLMGIQGDFNSPRTVVLAWPAPDPRSSLPLIHRIAGSTGQPVTGAAEQFVPMPELPGQVRINRDQGCHAQGAFEPAGLLAYGSTNQCKLPPFGQKLPISKGRFRLWIQPVDATQLNSV